MELKFSERINEIMDERGITPKQLAEATGISIQSIYSWKKGKSYKVYLSNLLKLCDFFECSVEFLIGRSETILDYTPQKYSPFYDRLREVMKKKGITRYRLVKESKIYDNYFTVWKNGCEPQIDTLIELANHIGCTIDYLVGRDNQ